LVIIGKDEFYRELNGSLRAMLAGEGDWLAGLANASALLYLAMEGINWAGFYLLKGDELVLGPFQGKPACVRIEVGRGVCGAAAKERRTVVVEDVRRFPGHIACDSNSRSEIVVPLRLGDRLLGVLDIDSPSTGRFDQEDARGLESFVGCLQESLHWPRPRRDVP
jgi:GAF domain-containing protein